MAKQRRKNRTPAELIAELEAKRVALENRAAMQAAKENPAVAPIVEALDSVKAEQRESAKILGNSPQGAAARIQKHQLWIDEIQASQAYAQVANGAQDAAIERLTALLTESISTLTSGEKLPKNLEKTIGGIVEGLHSDPSVAETYSSFESARNTRQSFGKEESEESAS